MGSILKVTVSFDLLVCCGGGGLTSGVAIGIARYAPNILVRPVEPVGYDDVTKSLASGKIIKNKDGSGSICDAIVTPQPGDLTFPIMQKYCSSGLVVSDEDCLKTMAIAYSRLKIVLEPGGAVALASAIFKKKDFKHKQQDMTELNSDGNRERGRYGEDLKKEDKYKDFTHACIEAEKSLVISYSSTAILTRRALELAVKWVFSYDQELEIPYQDNLAALIHDYRFKAIIDVKLFPMNKIVVSF